MKKSGWYFILCLTLLALVACGDGDEDGAQGQDGAPSISQ